MKKKKIFIFLLIIFISFFGLLSGKCYAGDEDEGEGEGEASTSTSLLIEGMDPNAGDDGDDLEDVKDEETTKDSSILYLLSSIFSLLQFIGTGVSIIMVLKLGISYMISSVEEKAQIKQRAVPIVIGSVLIVATVTIMKIIQVTVVDAFE